MKIEIKSIPYPIQLVCFWMLFFFFARAGFLLLVSTCYPASALAEWYKTFYYALRLDLSAGAYLTLIPFLTWSAGLLIRTEMIPVICKWTNRLLLAPVLITVLANYAVYRAWGTMVNYKAITFIQDPAAILASLSSFQILLLSLAIPLLYILIQKKLPVLNLKEISKENRKKNTITAAMMIVCIPLFIRGGLQTVPINNSIVWFSKSVQLNDAASNPVWYLADNVIKNSRSDKDTYQFLTEEESERRYEKNFPKDTSETKSIWKLKKPNIIVIALESWTADIIEPLGGETGITPFFSSLCDNGLLFDNIYASGQRTDQMFPSVLCGFPSIPKYSIVRFNDKVRSLPMLSNELVNAGYSSSFFYGGDLGFANMNSFLRNAGFGEIYGQEAFSPDEISSKWGAHDEYAFEKMLGVLRKQENPFFSMLLTLSTHEPFDVPLKGSPLPDNEPDKFRRAARYTDRCLENFFKSAAAEPWFKNTVFILVADHGHILPKRRDYYDPQTHHIPMLWTGPALPAEFAGRRVSTQGGQHDLAYTLLKQLGIENENFNFSRNLMDSLVSRPVYLNYETGIGWKIQNREFVYLFSENSFISKYTHLAESDSAETVKDGQAYLQKLFQNFSGL